ncbi:MAG: methytransferase partner Trm112 [bacterium]
MRKDLVTIVCCPVHKSPLELTVKKSDDHGDVQEGTLRCKRCNFDYPIEDGIPNLLPPEYHLDEVKEKAPKAPARGRK